jgi:hypothetical protein
MYILHIITIITSSNALIISAKVQVSGTSSLENIQKKLNIVISDYKTAGVTLLSGNFKQVLYPYF